MDPKYDKQISMERSKELLSVFEKFIDIYRSPAWPNNSTKTNDVVKSFELACAVENCMSNMDYSTSICNFLNVFYKYYSHKHKRDFNFDAVKFVKASDYIMQKFLTVGLNSQIADVALTEYMKKCGETRLQAVLKELILSSASCQVFETYLDNKQFDKESERTLQCDLFLNSLRNNFELIDEIIKKLLSRGDNLNSLDMICRSLLLNNLMYNEEIAAIEKSFVNLLSGKDSSSVLWNLFLKDIDKTILVSVSEKCPKIYKEIIFYLIRCSSHIFSENAEFDQVLWIVNRKTSPLPDLTYNCIVDLIKLLTKNSIKMRSEFSTMVNNSLQNPPFWCSVFKVCGISNDELWKNLDSFFDEDIFFDE